MASKEEKHGATGTGEKHSGKKHNNPLVYFGTIFILVIVVIAFVLVPALGSGAAGSPDDLTFGYWRKKAVRFTPDSYFAQQIDSVKDYYSQQGLTEENSQFLHYQVWRQAFENTVIHTALLDEAKRSNIIASEDFLAEQMAENEYFMENGTFSLRRFRETSVPVKTSIKQSILESTLKSRYVSDLVPIFNDAETAFIKTMASEERSLEYISFSMERYPDSERLAFAAANPDPFRQVKLSRITLRGTEQEAAATLTKIANGTLNFEDAARDLSTDSAASKGGALDWRYVWELRADFSDSAKLDELLALGAGTVSPLYESSTGSWMIFRIEESVKAPDTAAADYLSTISSYMDRFEKGRIEDWAINLASNFVDDFTSSGEPAIFSEYAAMQGYTAKQTNAFPLNYGKLFDLGYFSLFQTIDETQYTELAEAHNNVDFLTKVFSLQQGQLSEPLVLGNNIVVFQVSTVANAEESTLSMLESYYPYLLQESVQKEISSNILADERFQDNFLDTYLKYFSF
ncbi:MAG: SurA N-terminal domain-containing protein [Spirochaetes bacterium]|nr:SurA N-terminal domain-containing protein [Spirochaetota bacterium]MBU0955596.1 SurA N-terminal domain-containing protein [Spirochaetota bacterium]